MARRGGLVLVGIVPLAFAAVALATNGAQISNAHGPITLLTSSKVTVQANGQLPASCTRTSASPNIAFKLGDLVTIDCEGGVLTHMTSGLVHLGPTIPIPGLVDRFMGGVLAPGPYPTAAKCAAAWNATAPVAARQALAALAPLAVQVGIGSGDELSAPPSSHVVHSGPLCHITFVLWGTRFATTNGSWKGGTVQTWAGFIESGFRSVPAIGSYSMSADGTLTRAA